MPYEPNFNTTKGGFSGGETMGRCKQCGAPVTMQNIVKGPTGMFCSDTCRSQHESFVEKANAIERRERAPGGLISVWLRKIAASVIVAVVVILVAGFVAKRYNVDVPILVPAYEWLQYRISAIFGG